MTMKKIVTIDMDKAETGMQLATDAIDSQGVCLLSVGSVLTSGTIKGLQKRNIKQISVYEKLTLTAQQVLDIKSDLNEELDQKFKYLESFPALSKLKQVFYNFRIKDLDTDND